VVNQWIKSGLLKGKPFQSLANVLWHHFESVGTKAYTRSELHSMLSVLPLKRINVHTEITSTDYLAASAMPLLNWLYRLVLRSAGYSRPWSPSDFVQPGEQTKAAGRRQEQQGIVFTGNRFGFFHCITATKR
jgi:hypothetical protein